MLECGDFRSYAWTIQGIIFLFPEWTRTKADKWLRESDYSDYTFKTEVHPDCLRLLLLPVIWLLSSAISVGFISTPT
jgi:hypothetical protein